MEFFNKLKKMRIMLIDDDEWIRSSMTIFLESEGCQLTAMETAEKALSELEIKPYDIIITDYKLPGISGLEFLGRIQPLYSECHKVLITAFGNDNIISKALQLGVEKVIQKPFTTETIEKTLAYLIDKNEKENAN